MLGILGHIPPIWVLKGWLEGASTFLTRLIKFQSRLIKFRSSWVPPAASVSLDRSSKVHTWTSNIPKTMAHKPCIWDRPLFGGPGTSRMCCFSLPFCHRLLLTFSSDWVLVSHPLVIPAAEPASGNQHCSSLRGFADIV